MGYVAIVVEEDGTSSFVFLKGNNEKGHSEILLDVTYGEETPRSNWMDMESPVLQGPLVSLTQGHLQRGLI